MSKFLCVKAVVFLTYWQGVAIAILSWSGVLRTGVSLLPCLDCSACSGSLTTPCLLAKLHILHARVGCQSASGGRKRCAGSGLPLTQHHLQEWTTYDVDDVAAGLQEFLICVEMFFAALAHAHSFPPRDYMDPAGGAPRGFKQNLRIMFDVTDVVDDVQGVVDDTVSTLLQLACPSLFCQP